MALALLSLGLSACTIVFSLVYTVLLKPLPYPEARQLTYIWEANTRQKEPTTLIAPARLEDWRTRNRTFVAISGYYSDSKTDRSNSVPVRLHALMVAPGFFEVYGTAAAIGRTFTAEEERAFPAQAVVLGWEHWQRRFQGSPDVLGRHLRLGDQSFTVVGVMPRHFGGSETAVYVPQAVSPALLAARDARFLTGIGRLKAGVTVQQGQEDLARVQRELSEVYPKTDRGWSAQVMGMQATLTGNHGQSLTLAMSAVALLLLLACLNVGGLLLAQVQQRRNEFVIRVALGATGGQLGRGLLQEALLLAGAGWAITALLCSWSLPMLSKLLTTVPRMGELELDWHTLAFAGAAAIAATILVCVLPARQALWSGLSGVLAQGGRSVTDGRHTRFQQLLFVQVALTVVLLSCAGLLMSSYQRLTRVDTGFRTDHVLTFRIGAEWSEDRVAVAHLQQDVITALRGTPGVVDAGMTNFLPTEGATMRSRLEIEGLRPDTDDRATTVGTRNASGGYLAALRVRVVAGRVCRAVPEMFGQGAREIVVNQALANRFGGPGALIGRQARVLGGYGWERIVGVIQDVREDGPNLPAMPYAYECFAAGNWPDPEYAVLTRGDPEAFRRTLQQVVSRIAPQRPLSDVETLDSRAAEALQQPRLTAQMLAGFAGEALLLSVSGLHGLCSLLVAGRTREIGTRMALGARAGQVISGLFRSTMLVLVAGLICGMGLAAGAGWLIRSQLFGVMPFDAATTLVVCGVLAIASLLAVAGPSWRAARIDPIRAMRQD